MQDLKLLVDFLGFEMTTFLMKKKTTLLDEILLGAFGLIVIFAIVSETAKFIYRSIVAHPFEAALVLIFAVFAIIGLKRWRDSRCQIRFTPTDDEGTAPVSQWGVIAHRATGGDPAREALPATSKDQRMYQRQLQAVDDAYQIKPVKILEKGEARPFYAALDALKALQPATEGWHVHAQVSMGEFLSTGYEKAKDAFNSKRVDLLICNNLGLPMLVIEHQGMHHINPNTATEDELRNKVKHDVLRKAGIRLLETPKSTPVAEMRIAIINELETILQSRPRY